MFAPVPASQATSDELPQRLIPHGTARPFGLATSLFFLWGVPNNLNDVLIRQVEAQNLLHGRAVRRINNRYRQRYIRSHRTPVMKAYRSPRLPSGPRLNVGMPV
jgi:hypothetical protein